MARKKKKKSYIEQMLAWKYRMIPGYIQQEEEGDTPVPPVPPGPTPGGGGDVDPTTNTVEFGSETVVEPVDPEQPDVRVLATGSDITVEGNTLVLGSVDGNTVTL